MQAVARGDVLIAIPHGSTETYDLYAIKMKTSDYVVYNWLRNLYDQNKAKEFLLSSPSNAIEKLVNSIGDEKAVDWKVVALGVRINRLFTDVDVNFPLSRMLYVLEEYQFTPYYPLWMDVDFDRFLMTDTGGQILSFPKATTTTDRGQFLNNFKKYSSAATKEDFRTGAIDFETFIAAIIAGARCAEEGTNMTIGGQRGILTETKERWVIIRYRRVPTPQDVSGLFLKLPLRDNPIQNVYPEIVRRTESLRVKTSRQADDPSDESVAKAFENSVRESFGPLIPDYSM